MKNILLIENDEDTVKQVVDAINFDDYFIDIADTTERAYDLALRSLPVLIICSKEIFNFDPGDFLLRLREEPVFSTVPFIFLATKESARNIKKNTPSEFDYFLLKPFSDKEIQTMAKLALKKYYSALEKSEKKLNDLRTSISFALPHEFFTPLNGILGFSELLTKDFENLPKEEILQMLGYINRDAVRLKRITENFLLYAQLEMISIDSSKLTSIRNSYFINPKEIIAAACKQIAEEAGREDDLELELEDAVIRMNDSYAKKLIAEITDNAFKFSEKGSSVTVNMMSNDSSVLISVSDNGRGMLPEQISSIGAYMQFNRQTFDHQGSGLGLIIAKKISEIHGGSFAIESKINEGTKISIVFEY